MSKRQPKNLGGKTPDYITRDVNSAIRVQKALKFLLEEGGTWDEVAAHAGYASRGAAHNAVMREFDRSITHDVKELRTRELYMIQQIQSRSYKEAMKENNDGWTWAADRFVTLSKRKSELMGMDVSSKEQLTNQNYTKRIILTHQDGDQNSANA